MPKQVDHRERRETIARALWRVVDQRGVQRLSLREVAAEAEMSHGQLQHYFASRQEMLSFAMDFAAEQTAQRVARGLQALDAAPHPRDVLRLILIEMLPLHDDARATSRMNAAYVLEALHDNMIRNRAREGLRQGRQQVQELIAQAINDGKIAGDRDTNIETDRILALTGLTPLLDLEVINPGEALAAIDRHLDELFTS
ncbi:TetR/AcrR family transcriptional regulator [Mycolicibacterium wolinskyi]|uniref:TetR family transcriptional regulator n=1 Tax=Mycolicibacterium wolinskyi TaxID=59750 RepID=A0A1X2FFE8_9MYCO|nr:MULTISPECIES: TetR family transcriptional regulator C-terminal domain-containing protein [Mycolicibacterium]MCV7290747.1 TetR/AcrR family transcriptional regulator [Mycolicibacterium wolinskyi]MCV7291200.1 TetR/AcrR family transcriptional regulator [Mycolicibacterium goodii]ORX17175.1 TetR family transcriptional regulator [Mycolicibacterium wolinskyi]